jgi:hypothetical protein
MPSLTDALNGAQHAVRRAPVVRESMLVAGAGGALGSALLAETLVAGRFQRVAALVARPLTVAVPGLQALTWSALSQGDALGATISCLVFERRRHSNGRDDAFVMPEPDELLPLARALRAGGVRRLLVLLPHAPALLPHALKAGFASRDEAAVAALGFEQLLFVRAAQDATAPRPGPWLPRLAAWWLAQLRWMVPQREQALRAVVLARVVVQLAQRLAAAPAGTRVVPPELLWQAAQPEADAPALLEAWLERGTAFTRP